MLNCFRQRKESAPFPEALQYRVDAWSGRSKPLFRLPVPKINLIYGPRVGDVSDIKLIRTDTTLDLSQKAEKRYPTTVRPEEARAGTGTARPDRWQPGTERGRATGGGGG